MKPYTFTMTEGIIYKRDKPENRWKKVTNMIEAELQRKFLADNQKYI